MYWAIRAYHESLCHDRNSFITLTYADAPPKIEKEHLQNFFKRLRKASDRPIRYIACGEYGEETRRPHYHALIFGEDFLGGSYDIDNQLYSNPWLEKAWGHGITSVGTFTMQSACYVAGYVQKKANDPDTFNLMSRRPPIGKQWLERYWPELATRGYTVINGSKMPIPPVYYQWKEEELADIREKNRENIPALTESQYKAREINQFGKKQLTDHKL